MVGARQETVVDEEVFFDVETGIAALQVAGAVTAHAVAQGQVLRSRRGADRIGLDEAELINGARQGGRLEQGSSDGVATQVVERDRHVGMMPGCLTHCESAQFRCRQCQVSSFQDISINIEVKVRVTMHELKAKLSSYVARAPAGEVIEVTSHDKPLVRIIGVTRIDSPGVVRLLATGQATWGGGKPAFGIALEHAEGTATLSKMVLEDRV